MLNTQLAHLNHTTDGDWPLVEEWPFLLKGAFGKDSLGHCFVVMVAKSTWLFWIINTGAEFKAC